MYFKEIIFSRLSKLENLQAPCTLPKMAVLFPVVSQGTKMAAEKHAAYVIRCWKLFPAGSRKGHHSQPENSRLSELSTET